MDYFAIIGDHPDVKPSESLKALHSILKRSLPRDSRITVTAPTVSVTLPNGPGDFEFAPAYTEDRRVHAIPSDQSSAEWITSEPFRLSKVMLESSALCSSFPHYIRLLKLWKYANGLPLRSLYIELLIAEWAPRLRGLSLQDGLLSIGRAIAERGWRGLELSTSNNVILPFSEMQESEFPSRYAVRDQWESIIGHANAGRDAESLAGLSTFFRRTDPMAPLPVESLDQRWKSGREPKLWELRRADRVAAKALRKARTMKTLARCL